jgi:hypothetical protein
MGKECQENFTITAPDIPVVGGKLVLLLLKQRNIILCDGEQHSLHGLPCRTMTENGTYINCHAIYYTNFSFYEID